MKILDNLLYLAGGYSSDELTNAQTVERRQIRQLGLASLISILASTISWGIASSLFASSLFASNAILAELILMFVIIFIPIIMFSLNRTLFYRSDIAKDSGILLPLFRLAIIVASTTLCFHALSGVDIYGMMLPFILAGFELYPLVLKMSISQTIAGHREQSRFEHEHMRNDRKQMYANLLALPFELVNKAKLIITQHENARMMLAENNVSISTLENAAKFRRLSSDKKAAVLAIRVNSKNNSILNISAESSGLALYRQKLPENFPLNINHIFICFPKQTKPADVFDTLNNQTEASSHITLIIGNSSDYQRQLYKVTEDTGNKWIAPQGSEITRLLLTPDAETTLAEILAGQLSLQQISPYRIGGGVNNESVFFGRRELISQIINRDPANYLIVGGRQVGKSSLLKAIERRYADNPQVECVYLTLSNEVLVPRLASLLKLEHTNNAEVLATMLDERISKSGQRLVFLIDEADRFIAQEKSHDYAILNVFRRLSEEGNCTFILAGFWQLYQHAVLDYQSPIRNFGELLSVGELEKLACTELVTQPMKTMNLSYTNETLVDHIVDSCGQRANLIAIACQHIVRNLPPQQLVIEAGDVAFALKSDEVRRALSGWVLGETEHEQSYERMVVYSTIGMRSFTTGNLLELAEQHDIAVDTLELDRTLSRLELAFVLGRKDGRWFYRVPLFVDYIAEDSPELKLQAELKRIVQQR